MYDIEILSIFDFYPKKKYQFVLNQMIRIKEGACIDYSHSRSLSAGLIDFYITLPYTLTIG